MDSGPLCFLSFLLLSQGESWNEMPPLRTPRQEVGVASLAGKVYVIGGILADRSATGIVERFDASLRTWEAISPLPDKVRLHHIGAASAAGKVYAVGGLNSLFRGVESVFAYDPAAEEWQRAADLPAARGAMGVAAAGGKIYAAGGQDGNTSFQDFAVFFPGEDRWQELPSMPTARNHLAAAGVGSLFYAVGGRAAGLRGALERFDPGSGDPVMGRWETLSPLPTPRGGIAAAVAGGRIHVFGGEGNSASPAGVFAENEAYDLAADRWSSRCPMPRALHGIGAAEVDGVIYIPGGGPVQGFGVTDLHQAYTPPAAGFELLRGDANQDGDVDLGDVLFTLFELFVEPGIGFPCPAAADATKDGQADVADVAFLLGFLFRGGPSPPAF